MRVVFRKNSISRFFVAARLVASLRLKESVTVALCFVALCMFTAGANAENHDACFDENAVGADASSSSLLIETPLYVVNPASNTNQQTFLRFVNPNDSSTSVEIYGIDDGGNRSKKGAVSFTLGPRESKQITAQDIENGNSNKGLSGNLCDGQGKWQFRIRSNNPIKVIGLIRTPGGFLTGLNDVVPGTANDNIAYFVNPSSNTQQQTFLRIVNLSATSDTVIISGIDDAGVTSVGTVSLVLGANESKQVSIQDLENGNTGKGLTGNLDNGSGKWRLTVTSSLELRIISMIRTPDGFLTNLSGMVDANNAGERIIYFANPASETDKATFLRIINTSNEAGTVTIAGTDENGNGAPGGDVMFAIAANAATQMTMQDLENGNIAKGLMGSLGDGEGRWRLTVSADADIQVMSLIRTPDGFLTNLSRTTPVSGGVNDVLLFNPGSNINQRSSLRIVNNSSQQGSITISGVDDSGAEAPGGDVIFNIAANAGMSVTAQDLENGNGALGLVGSLGNGSGKWHLQVTSDVDLQVQSLLDTPTGFLTNLSAAGPVVAAPPPVVDAELGGVWTGTITSNQGVDNYMGITTDDGSFRFFSLGSLAQFHGNLQVATNDLTGSGLAVLDGAQEISVTLTGQIVERETLNGNWQGSGDSGVIDFEYWDVHLRSGTTEKLAGLWKAYSGGSAWLELNLTNGTVDGSDVLNCTHKGSILPVDTQYNTYLIQDNVTGCSIAGLYVGLSALQDGTDPNDTLMFAVDNGTYYITGLLVRD